MLCGHRPVRIDTHPSAGAGPPRPPTVTSQPLTLKLLDPREFGGPRTGARENRKSLKGLRAVTLYKYQVFGILKTGRLNQCRHPEHPCSTIISCRGLPWWRSGWESACQCRGHGFEPWSGKIPHAAEQLSPCTTTTEPARLEPVLLNKRGRDSERPAHRDEEWPPLAAIGESPRTETKTQHSQK